jgi:RNA polymerase sigma-70 factor (ECF subfamily)
MPTLDQLVSLYLQDVHAYAWRLSRSTGDAEELVQQVFLAAREQLSQLRDPNRARGWLLAITRNCFLRDLRRRRPVSESDAAVELHQVTDPTWDVEPIDGERLEAALQTLSEPYRVALMMYYFEDLSYQEMARTLEIPMGTVMSRLARAKRHLRRAWEAAASRAG